MDPARCLPAPMPTPKRKAALWPAPWCAALAIALAPAASPAQPAPDGMEALPADPVLRALVDESLAARPERLGRSFARQLDGHRAAV